MTKALTTTTVDIDELEFELPKELDNFKSLEMFEQQVFIAFDDIDAAFQQAKDGYTRAAYHTHMILEHNLWRHRKTPEGAQVFGTQEEYLERLSDHNHRGFAVSTVKAFNTSIKMARCLGLDRQRIEDVGIHIINEVSKLVEKDYKTSKPLRLKEGDLPPDRELFEYLREVIDTVSSNPERPDIILRPKDVKQELYRLLAPRRPAINFVHYHGQPMNVVRWEFEIFDEEGRMTPSQYGNVRIMWEDNPPAAVMEEFYRMIKVNLT